MRSKTEKALTEVETGDWNKNRQIIRENTETANNIGLIAVNNGNSYVKLLSNSKNWNEQALRGQTRQFWIESGFRYIAKTDLLRYRYIATFWLIFFAVLDFTYK